MEVPWRTSGSRAASSVGWFDGDPVDDVADCCRAGAHQCMHASAMTGRSRTLRPASNGGRESAGRDRPGSVNCDGTDGFVGSLM